MSEESQDKQPISVYDVIVIMIDQIAGLAWQKLGLQPDMVTGQIHKDVAEAKVAIDLVAQLAAQVETRLDADDRREMQKLISNLRLNYVEKSKEAAE